MEKRKCKQRLKILWNRNEERGRVTRATTAKNERKVKRMAMESRPCDDGGEATVRCCESMAVDNLFFLFVLYRFFAAFLGLCKEILSASLAVLFGQSTLILLLQSETRMCTPLFAQVFATASSKPNF